MSRLRRGGVVLSTVIVDDFNFVGICVPPGKAKPPLIVDAYRVSTGTIAREFLKPMSRNPPKFIEARGGMKSQKLLQCTAPGVRRHSPAGATEKVIGRLARSEVLDHAAT
jgi:hypothetical protein